MSLATRYRNLPIKHKLRAIIMSTVSVALLLACTAVAAYNQLAARDEMRNDLSVMAELLASNSTAVLAFRDQVFAAELLCGFPPEQAQCCSRCMR
jgi:hypothetical protein